MQALNRISGFVLIVCATVAAATASAEPSNTNLRKAIADLRAGSNELRREDAAFRKSRKEKKLSRGELGDYAAFVAGLRLRVLKQCEMVRALGGEDALKKFDCVTLTRNQTGARLRTGNPTSTIGADILTDEEKKKSLDARLNALEAEIDENLLKRQQEIRQSATNRGAKPSGGAGGSAKGSGSAADKTGGEPTDSQGKSTTTTVGDPQAGGEERAAQPGWGAPSVSRSAPKRNQGRTPKRERATADGSDDDVIARQLREAAERETDPILKEKLWDEYKKYKASRK